MVPARGLEELTRTLREASGARSPSAASSVFGRPSRAVPCGWRTVDGSMGAPSSETAKGLVRGGVHEWFGVGAGVAAGDAGGRAPRDWAPPLFVLAHVARRAVLDATARGAPATVVWVGRRVWPYPRALTGGVEVVEAPHGGTLHDDPSRGGPSHDIGEFEITLALRETPAAFAADGGDLFGRSLFVDPPDAGLRLWAIDTALRCGGVTAVVADGSGLGMAATRRLQLAAAAADALVLTARPPSEIREVSAATTRWTVARAPDDGPSEGPRWSTTLLRAKGAQRLCRSRARDAAARHERRRSVG